MKQCQAIFLPNELYDNAVDWEIAAADQLEKNTIDNLLWSDNEYTPEVSFSIAHTHKNILLKYNVSEQYLTARYREINDPVFKDSCVEFFIAFDNDDNYYNLEFNCLGTPLIAYGSGKDNRKKIEKRLAEKIKSYQLIKNPIANQSSLINWELVLVIPFEVFAHHNITTLKDRVCKANFYKCGDDLPEPHFLSWNNISYPSPDFHLPQFFGGVHFVS